MPRSLVLGNGHFLLNFDEFYRIRDVYYPRIGMANHSEGALFRLGVWCSGRMWWVDASWKRSIRYEAGSLVAATTLTQPELGLELHCRDAVDSERDVFCRELDVRDLLGKDRDVRVFLHHDFRISGNAVGDTVFYDPELDAIIHYKRDRYFMVGGGQAPDFRLAAYATGQARINNTEGTWRDAADGELSGNAITQGSVDSIIALDLNVPASGQARAYYWIAAGERYGDLLKSHAYVTEGGPATLIDRTSSYWRLWVDTGEASLAGLPEDLADLYRTSLLVMRTHVDDGGAIIAATDSDILGFARDTYAYVWPRDGALVADAFDRAGYATVTRRFFAFAAHLVKREGYFLHKYHSDRSLASSWHPWLDARGERVLPIQEDETGLVIWALWRHFERWGDVEEIRPLYHRFILPAAGFLAEYRDAATGLPRPSWDLWEERWGVLTYTCAAVWAGLEAGSRFAAAFGDHQTAQRYRHAADETHAAVLRGLWDAETRAFLRGLVWLNGGSAPSRDSTADSSMFLLPLLGFLPADDERIVSTLERIVEAVKVDTSVGGLARYPGDAYHAVAPDRTPGNPWVIAQCWHARWLIGRAADGEELDAALEPLRWVVDHASEAGMLPEQLDPVSGRPLSVAPLVWSHAEFVVAVREFLARRAGVSVCPTCGTARCDLDQALR